MILKQRKVIILRKESVIKGESVSIQLHIKIFFSYVMNDQKVHSE